VEEEEEEVRNVEGRGKQELPEWHWKRTGQAAPPRTIVVLIVSP
jgi:hypothetical protein